MFLLALLANMALIRHMGVVDLRITRAFQQIAVLEEVLAMYRKDHGELPTNEQGLDVLAQQNYLDHSLTDPWGNAYVYRRANNSTGYLLYSRGFNQIDENEGGDDVTNPSKKYACNPYGLNCPWTVSDVAVFATATLVVAGLLGFFAFGGFALYGRLLQAGKKTGFPPARE